MTKSDLAYLRHILDACATLSEVRDRARSAAGLEARLVERAAAERLLTVIGGPAKNVSPAFRAGHPEIPWQAMAGMRDRLVHHYFGVDYEAVRATIAGDLHRSALGRADVRRTPPVSWTDPMRMRRHPPAPGGMPRVKG